MTDADNLRSGLEVKLLKAERDRADALAGIVEYALDSLATMGTEDSASEVALIEARGCLASALRRDDGRPLAVLVTEVRDILDACRAALDMNPAECAGAIVAQIKRRDRAWKEEVAECREAIAIVKADADRWRADHAVEVEGLRAEIAELRPGPWRTPDEEPPPRGDWIVIETIADAIYPAVLSDGQTVAWIRRWRRLPVDLLKAPVAT